MSTMTRTRAEKIISSVAAAVTAEEYEEATRPISAYLGEGEPRADLDSIADDLGPDYICALDDGAILAWTWEKPLRSYQGTRSGRMLGIVG